MRTSIRNGFRLLLDYHRLPQTDAVCEGYSFAETQGSLTHASHVVRVKRERLRARQALLFSEDRT